MTWKDVVDRKRQEWSHERGKKEDMPVKLMHVWRKDVVDLCQFGDVDPTVQAIPANVKVT